MGILLLYMSLPPSILKVVMETIVIMSAKIEQHEIEVGLLICHDKKMDKL